MNFFDRTFRVLCSLKLAVLVIFGIAVALAAGTILESLYDTPTSRYWVYQSSWFYGLLVLFGLNILCVAISRLPWKVRHIPFLLAHLGILILLWGSFLTQKIGVDGNLRITEGETTSVVELDQSAFVVSDRDQVWSIPIRWSPPGVQFNPFSVSQRGIPLPIQIDQFLSHADSSVSFIPDPEESSPSSAIQIKIIGGAMGIAQEFWLWEGSPQWKDLQAGPARLFLGSRKELQKSIQELPRKQPLLAFFPEKGGAVSYWAQGSDGKKVEGKLKKDQILEHSRGRTLEPGWKGKVQIQVLNWIPRALPFTSYRPARVQNGQFAPAPAIHVKTGLNGEGADVWLGLGDRAVLHLGDRNVDIGYFPKRIVLPFSVRLERFMVEHDPGTSNPAAYSSRVLTTDEKGQKESLIGMNEPLEFHGFTLYQASYEPGEPRPITSILSVNQDPGRVWKYLGSFLIVLGSVLLFAAKYRFKSKEKKALGQKVAKPAGSPRAELNVT